MATGNTGGNTGSGRGGRRGSRLLRIALVGALVIGGAALWANSDAVAGQASAATAYGARTACGCRHLGGRDLASCENDFVPGMWAVFLTEDEGEQSVTATVPLVSSDTARMREGFGCVLDSWEG